MAFSAELTEEGAQVLKHKMLWVALALVLSVSWWWPSQSELDQAPKKATYEQLIENETDGSQSLVENGVVAETEELVYSEMPQLDENVAEFKYKNLKRLMSIRVDALDEYQIEMVVQQLISQLP